MKSRLNIKNFRVFDSEGYTFDINPITLLTGCNSSGKSSLVKACALFSEWIKQISIKGFQALFTEPLRLSNDTLKLGRLDTVTNSNKDKTIVYTITRSDIAPEDIFITYTFIKRKHDITNDAWLSKLLVTDSHNRVIFDADRDCTEHIINLYPLKQWVIEVSKFRDIKRDLHLGGPTPTSENISEVGTELAKICKTTREYRNQLAHYIQNNYSTSFDERVNDCIGHIHIAAPLFYTASFIYVEKFKKLDNVDKKLLYDYVLELIDKGELYPKDAMYPEKFQDKINCTLKELCQHYVESPYQTLREFINSLENENGLTFAYPNDTDIRPDTMKYQVLDEYQGTIAGHLYRKYANLIGTLFFGQIKRKEILSCGMLETFISETAVPFIKEAVLPKTYFEFRYIGTCQLILSRVFSLNRDTDMFSIILNEYINTTNNLGPKYKSGKFINSRGVFVNKWLEKFSIGSKVVLKQTEEGAGVAISIKDLYSDCMTNLCDMGYGIAQLLSILFAIETAIFRSMKMTEDEHVTLSIEEPESHLHPKYQSLLASMFAEAYLNFGVHFIIETHSEYMIRAFQKLIAYGPKNNEYGLSNDDISIFYFNEPRKELRGENEQQIRKIEIAEDGCLVHPFGPGFFDEALNLSTDLLRIKLEGYAKK